MSDSNKFDREFPEKPSQGGRVMRQLRQRASVRMADRKGKEMVDISKDNDESKRRKRDER